MPCRRYVVIRSPVVNLVMKCFRFTNQLKFLNDHDIRIGYGLQQLGFKVAFKFVPPRMARIPRQHSTRGVISNNGTGGNIPPTIPSYRLFSRIWNSNLPFPCSSSCRPRVTRCSYPSIVQSYPPYELHI